MLEKCERNNIDIVKKILSKRLVLPSILGSIKHKEE